MGTVKISERKLILLTVGCLVIAGLVRLANYMVGTVFFYLAFCPYIYHRLKFYIINRRGISKLDVNRRTILIIMVFIIVMNAIGLQNIEFLLLLLLGLDFLLLSNHRVSG